MTIEPLNVGTIILGGTFDPVHYGHLRAAAELRDRLGVADFRLLPAGQPPHRDNTKATGQQRLSMLRLALKEHPDLGVDDREINRSGPSYMVDTLAELRHQFPQRPLVLVLGQDAANNLDHWYQWRRLFELTHLVVMTRPESQRVYEGALALSMQQAETEQLECLWRQPAGLVLHVPVTQLAISSTDIRSQIKQGEDPRFLLPDIVLNYIRANDLYQV